MPLMLRKDIYEKTKRLIHGVEELGTVEKDIKEWLETNYGFKVCNVVLNFPVKANDEADDTYVVYIIQQESRIESERVHKLMDEHYREWLLGFINIGLKHHLKVDKPIEIRLFDFYEEIYYDFQNYYNVHFDAEEYYKQLNPRINIYRCFRLCRPVILFDTEEHKRKYEADGVLETIQEQYEDFLKRYDSLEVAKGEKVVFGSKEQLTNEYFGDINKYFE